MPLALHIPLLNDTTPSFVDANRNVWEFLYAEVAQKYLAGYQQGIFRAQKSIAQAGNSGTVDKSVEFILPLIAA